MLGQTGQFTLSGTYGFEARISWSETYDIASNSSELAITALEIRKTQPYYSALMWLDGDLTVNGAEAVRFNGMAASHVVTTGDAWSAVHSQAPAVYPDPPWSVTVPHAADGTASASVRLSVRCYSNTAGSGSGFSIVGSSTVTLTAIPRASAVSAPAGLIGSPLPVTVSRAAAGAVHTVTYSLGGASGTVAENTGSTALTWTPPMSLCSQLQSAEAGTCTLTCMTYVGGVLTGTSTCSVPLAVPASVGLTLVSGWAAVSYDNTDTPAATVAGYVQGYSRARVTIDSTKIDTSSAYGATAVSKCVELGTERVTAAPYVTSPIAAAGTLPVRVTVTDSRGRTKAYSTNITVMPYTAPTLSAVTLCRSDADGEPDADGAYIAARATANVSSLGGQNTASMSAAWCVRGGEYGSETPLVNSTPAVLGGGLIDTQYTYSARITLTDLLGQTAAYECDIPTASVAFHLREGGRGAAFGKYAEADGELQLPTGWALRIGSAALDAASLAALLELLES